MHHALLVAHVLLQCSLFLDSWESCLCVAGPEFVLRLYVQATMSRVSSTQSPHNSRSEACCEAAAVSPLLPRFPLRARVLVCSFWANTYTRKGEKKLASDETLKKKLALEPNVTLIVSRTDAFRYMKLVQLVERLRPDVGVVMLAREGVDVVGKYLRGLKVRRVREMQSTRRLGSSSPTSARPRCVEYGGC